MNIIKKASNMCSQFPTSSPRMHLSNSIDDDDNSSSDLKWESMSVASEQSNMTRFDTIEDVSHAIGMLIIISDANKKKHV